MYELFVVNRTHRFYIYRQAVHQCSVKTISSGT